MILKLCKEKTVQMRYKNGTPEVQIFVEYKLFKWGTVLQNGVRLATLIIIVLKKVKRSCLLLAVSSYRIRTYQDVVILHQLLFHAKMNTNNYL